MKKVLIITYYWPPSGGSGVQRWLKFAKYLPMYGWEPHVFTPEDPSFGIQDPSLEKDIPPEAEVIHFPIWEPYDIFLRMSGWFGSGKKATPAALVGARGGTLFETIALWLRGNLFIPDPRRFWVKPSAKFLSGYLADNGIGTIITTGPPHSVHLIGLKLKSSYPHLRWLADFRDPWSEWGLWESLKVSQLVRNMHRRLERKVLEAADEVLTITPFYVRRFEALGQRKVRLLTNGFDEDDFRSINFTRTTKFVIRHVGIINEKCDPRPFLIALERAIERDADFAQHVQLEFIGQVHPGVRSFVGEKRLLDSVTRFTGNVPHKQLLAMYGASSLLLLILTGYKDAEGYLPGKVFEYLASGLPILGIGPLNGDAAVVLRESRAGIMVDSADQEGMITALIESFARWKRETTAHPEHSVHVAKFSRRVITARLADILDN